MTRSAQVLFFSAFIGFVLGFFIFPTYQVCVETAQVLSGVVEYSRPLPNLFYHLQVWNLPSQVSAVLLTIGLNELYVSKIITGLIFIFAFSGISGICYYISKNYYFSISFPLIFAFFELAWDLGVAYPILLLHSGHSFGMFGLYVTIFILALYFLNFKKNAYFFVGLMFAIHPTYGCFLIVLIVAYELTLYINTKQLPILSNKKNLIFFLFGLILSIVSYTFQKYQYSSSPFYAMEFIENKQMFDDFITFHDFHRQPFRYTEHGFIFSGLAFLVFVYGRLKNIISKEDFIFYGLLFGITFSLSIISLIPKEYVLDFFYIVIPGRFFNVTALMFLVVSFAYLANNTINKNYIMLIALMAFIVFCRYIVIVFPAIEIIGYKINYLNAIAFIVTYILPLVLFVAFTPYCKKVFSTKDYTILYGVILSSAVFIAVHGTYRSFVKYGGYEYIQNNYEKLSLYIKTNKLNGAVLIDSKMPNFQLMTRTQVVLDTNGLDGFSYFPKYITTLEPYLRDLYFQNINEHRGFKNGVISSEHHAKWKKLSNQEWINLSRKYFFKYVVTKDIMCDLDLQLLYSNEGYCLYDITK